MLFLKQKEVMLRKHIKPKFQSRRMKSQELFGPTSNNYALTTLNFSHSHALNFAFVIYIFDFCGPSIPKSHF